MRFDGVHSGDPYLPPGITQKMLDDQVDDDQDEDDGFEGTCSSCHEPIRHGRCKCDYYDRKVDELREHGWPFIPRCLRDDR